MKKNTLIVIAGEDSGDIYGALLIHEIRKLHPELRVTGMGGSRMEAEGTQLLCHVSETAVMGAVEMLDKIFFLYKKLREVVTLLRSGRVAGVVLIDYPDFNLRVASAAKKFGIPVFYYISPQIWAWRKWRIQSIKRTVTKMMVILPFEKKFYEGEGVTVDFVGHPLIDIVKPAQPKEDLIKAFHLTGKNPIIGLLPGSRKKEVMSLFPEILLAVKELKIIYPDASFLLPVSPSLDAGFIKDFVEGKDRDIHIIYGRNYDVMAVSDILITKSGTSTLESAIMGIPMVILYKASFFSILMARLLVKVRFAGLPNLILEKKAVPELLQEKMSAKNIVKEVTSMLDNKIIKKRVENDLGKIKKMLGDGRASLKAAQIIVQGLIH